jgi:hypothetical protein
MVGEAAIGRAVVGIGGRVLARGALAALGPVGWVALGALTLYDGYQLYNMMSESAEDKDAVTNANPEECTGDCAKKEERQKKRKEELEGEAGVEQKTKGKTKHGEKGGGMTEADKDFDSLEPKGTQDINTKYGPGRTGTLEDGTRVTVRPGSSDGRPTLEIRNPGNGRGSEIRYDFSGS